MQPQIINCETHDLIEIICMRGYEVQLHLQDGNQVAGHAKTTLVRDGQEYLQLQQSAQLLDVALLQIFRIEVLTPGASPAEIWPHAAAACLR